MARRILFALLALGSLSVVAVALEIGSRPEPVHRFSTEHYAVQVSTVVTGLSHPWSLAFLPGGDVLVTERDGRLRRIHNGVLQRGSLDGTPRLHVSGQQGLLDIALHPQFAQNRLLYLTYS
jgi:aldose sugar dehydrogenase